MASLTSVISLIVLLATYGYSLPVEDQFQSSTSNYEFSAGKTIFDTTHTITARLMNEEESASEPTMKVVPGFSGQDSFEYTTPAQSESHEHGTRESRMNADGLFTSSPFTYISETPSSDLSSRGFSESEFLDTTTIEIEKAYVRRRDDGIFDDKKGVSDNSTSAEFFSTKPAYEHEFVPSTSGDSFGKFTGRLSNGRKQKTSTGMEELPTAESSEDNWSAQKPERPKSSITKDQETDSTERLPNSVKTIHTITKSKTQSSSKKDASEKETESELTEKFFAAPLKVKSNLDKHHEYDEH